MSLLSRFGIGALMLLLTTLSSGAQVSLPPQYVIISFDGASLIEQWERSRALAQRTGARFTYFLSCVYLLAPEHRDLYRAPGYKAGRSNVGYGYSRKDVHRRLEQIWKARGEGHEIANHGCGHFDGSTWKAEDWKEEFRQFNAIVTDAWRINGLNGEPQGWRSFVEKEIVGFRAPYLETSPGLFAALAEGGFRYDASTVTPQPENPPIKGGLARFSLPLIPEGPAGRKIIAMDYNLYVRHSGGVEKPEEAAAFRQRAYSAFRAAFDREYSGRRTPLQIGFHFTLMNDGAYWQALEQLAEDVCVKPDVRCVSYRDYLDAVSGPRQDGRS
ncbi:polysaccharide deacetylase [Chelativorans sp. Marseille-P2723]|uniref:polysaccharide deacetylase n=1 Tax=Chelativorans sp. Marseille-P2723 TaxID=2709133 RepID=UPI001FF061BB|nr:polysaccharide deacetylase [Chelativorans sp. Marseille-P2723]